MVHRSRSRSVSRWLLTIMATFLALGHVCELPAYAALVIPAHGTEDPSADGHEHEAELSCDPVDAVSNTTSLVKVTGPLLELTQALVVVSPVPGLVTLSSIESSTRLPGRVPLFVLYASLLI